jgi:hypothetical protein
MKWTTRFAALVVLLVLAFGVAEVMRPSAAFANDDVEFLGPPPTKGDPDSGGPHYFGITWNSMIGAIKQSLSSLMSVADRRAGSQRSLTPRRPAPGRTRPR